jgi:exosortase family protein XrtM
LTLAGFIIKLFSRYATFRRSSSLNALNNFRASWGDVQKGDLLHLPLPLKFFINQNRREISFVGKFILFLLIGQVIYISIRPSVSPFLTAKLTANVSTHLINLFIPGEHASANVTIIQGTTSLNIVTGCDGIEGLILIISAIGAFPMPVSLKCTGIAIGTMVIYVSNLLRVVALYATLKLRPDAFSFVHMYAGQAYTIFIGLLFFLAWAGRAKVAHEASH